MTEIPVTDWANYEGDLPERYPHRQPRKSGRGTEPIAGPDRKAYTKEKRRRLKARSPTLTVTKVKPNKKIPTLNDITFENGLVAGYPKTKNAKVGDKFVVASHDGRFAHIMDAESYNAEEWPKHECITCAEGMDELVAKGQSWGCECCGLLVGTEGEHEGCGSNKNGFVLCHVCETDQCDSVGCEMMVTSEQKKRSRYDSEEGNAPIQDPMEFGEMANWTPLDGSEGLKRKRAETFEADFDYYYSVYDKARGMEILDRLRTMNPETKSKALDWLIDNGFLHSEEVYNSAYINAMGDALYITSDEDDYDAEVMNYSDYVKDAETFNALSPICKRCGLSEAGSHQLDPTGETGICIICAFNQKMGLNAESFDKEGIAYYSCDICDKPAKYNFQDSTLRWEIIDDDFADKPMWSEDSGQGFNDFYCGDCAKKEETSRFFNAESPSATIPVNEPTWVKPVATALGFALGFLGIHEIKKVL